MVTVLNCKQAPRRLPVATQRVNTSLTHKHYAAHTFGIVIQHDPAAQRGLAAGGAGDGPLRPQRGVQVGRHGADGAALRADQLPNAAVHLYRQACAAAYWDLCR